VKLIVATEAGHELAVRCCREREWLGPALGGLEPAQLETVREALALLVGA
jgi:hypothetical protein